VFDWHRVATCCPIHDRPPVFASNLPPDFGLRASLGRLPSGEESP
jgi:hypothetical protein